MSSSRERGSVLLADVVLGCAIVAVVASGATAAGLIIDAGQTSREAARDAAVALARGWEPTGVLRRMEQIALPHSTIEVDTAGGTATVRVSVDISVPNPVTGRLHATIAASSSVPIAPYRSRRDG